MVVAASFGLAAALSVVVLGDESGYLTTEHQKMKIAAIEAMWETEPAPASFNLFAIPDQENQTNHFSVEIPYLMRSEEHTSELQSLMRISYAVFCLQK